MEWAHEALDKAATAARVARDAVRRNAKPSGQGFRHVVLTDAEFDSIETLCDLVDPVDGEPDFEAALRETRAAVAPFVQGEIDRLRNMLGAFQKRNADLLNAGGRDGCQYTGETCKAIEAAIAALANEYE